MYKLLFFILVTDLPHIVVENFLLKINSASAGNELRVGNHDIVDL